MTKWGEIATTVEDVAKIITEMSLIYPSRKMTPKEVEIVVGLWYSDLREYSTSTIKKACEKYRRSTEGTFFPHPGAIISLCESIDGYIDPTCSKLLKIEKLAEWERLKNGNPIAK